MKLASALSERADMQKRILQLKVRLGNNAKVQEGEEPTESPMELLSELESIFTDLEILISRINATNNATKLPDGTSLTDLIAKRDCLTQKINIEREFLNNASALVDRYSGREIKIKSSVDVKKLQKRVDKLSKELREVEEQIQSINWTTELI